MSIIYSSQYYKKSSMIIVPFAMMILESLQKCAPLEPHLWNFETPHLRTLFCDRVVHPSFRPYYLPSFLLLYKGIPFSYLLLLLQYWMEFNETFIESLLHIPIALHRASSILDVDPNQSWKVHYIKWGSWGINFVTVLTCEVNIRNGVLIPVI